MAMVVEYPDTPTVRVITSGASVAVFVGEEVDDYWSNYLSNPGPDELWDGQDEPDPQYEAHRAGYDVPDWYEPNY